MILADTPWTFPFVLAWMLLSVIAPVVFAVTAVLVVRRVTRRIGLVMLFGGAVGSLCGVLGDLGFMVAVGEHLSQTTLAGWLFAIAGGFSLLSIPVGVFAAVRSHRLGLTNR